MNTRNRPIIDLGLLESTMYQIITALTDAIVRQAAAEHRGPMNNPNPEAWEIYIQELREELGACRRRLDEYLASIAWEEAPLPGNLDHWPDWWDAVRLSASRTPYLPDGFLLTPLVE